MQYDQIVFLSFWLMITDQMFVRIKSWCKKILIFHLWIIFHDKMSQMKSKSITDDARKRREKNQKNFQLTIHKNSDELSCRSIGWGWNEFFGSCLHSNAWGRTLEGERFWNHDVDWGGDTVDRKSKTRFVVYVRGMLVSWISQKQNTLARSSIEVEYRAVTTTTHKVVLSMLLNWG